MTWPMQLNAAYRHYFDDYEERMDPGLVACIRSVDGMTGTDYLKMRARKLAYVEAVHRFFEEWDLLLTPTVSVAAFPADRQRPEHWPSPPVGLDRLGRVLLSLQLQRQPRGLRALRLHRCGPARRHANRGQALRRTNRAPGRPRFRAGAPVGGSASCAVTGWLFCRPRPLCFGTGRCEKVQAHLPQGRHSRPGPPLEGFGSSSAPGRWADSLHRPPPTPPQ